MKTAVNIAVFFLSLFLVVCFAEAFFWIADLHPPELVTSERYKDVRKLYQKNSVAVWRGNLGNKMEFENTVRTNSRGFHDAEYSLEKDPSVYRIVVIGDSFVAAYQVPLEQTFHKLLEKELNEEVKAKGFSKSVEVIALGKAGAGSIKELITLIRSGFDYSPDLVIALLTDTNDFNDAWHEDRRMRKIEPRNLDTAFPREEVTDAVSLYEKLLIWPGSRLNRWVAFQAVRLAGRKSKNERNRRIWEDSLGIYALPGTAYYEATKEKWENAARLVAASYRRMNQLCRSRSVDFMAVFLNRPFVYDKTRRKELFALLPEFREQLDFDKPIRWLKEVFRRDGIPYIDLSPYFQRSYNISGALAHYAHDGHWNPKGHRLTADLLKDYVLERYSQGFRETGTGGSA